MKKLVGVLLGFGLVCSVNAQEPPQGAQVLPSSEMDVIQKTIDEFYKQEQGNKITVFNMMGLTMAIDQQLGLWRKQQKRAEQAEVMKSIQDNKTPPASTHKE